MWLNIYTSTKASKCHKQIWKGERRPREDAKLWKRPTKPRELPVLVHACNHTRCHLLSMLVELPKCASTELGCGAPRWAKPEFLFSWCLHTCRRDKHWSSKCTNICKIAIVRNAMKGYMALWQNITERLAQSGRSEQRNFPNKRCLIWALRDVYWVKKVEKSSPGTRICVEALGWQVWGLNGKESLGTMGNMKLEGGKDQAPRDCGPHDEDSLFFF